ncbi:pyridoxamine 5'-phosphate oxidase [Paenibacillus sp. A3]|uniref:pyridoxamine 5'-phosphate oxidase family protein n=1 Tax=Paenibacillus sp. A3 TaxID=1337054 RepID=UPI0006D5A88B|nr:pyridoxamine 5'-phosphate oxidase family protein [Paenibacillus sp. A3]KPV56551.1 pyridoxamine 5'-phosphate oxidase [Paenibacillus sp. A3]
MGKLFPALLPEHEAFIRRQRLFFVGSAPLQSEGHVNLSPKGHDVFRIVSPTEVGYLDLTGSGNETSAHLEENGRITLMFVAFEGPPLILRLYGKGRVILPGTPDWETWSPRFELLPGARQIIGVDVRAVKTSCGFSVPFYSYEKERDTLQRWAATKSDDELNDYWRSKNAVSMDGIPTPLGRRIAESAPFEDEGSAKDEKTRP